MPMIRIDETGMCRIPKEIVETNGTKFLQQHGDPEHRKRKEEERHEGHAVVQPAVLAQCRHDAERNADHNGENSRSSHQQNRHSHGAAKSLGDRLAVQRITQVALPDEGNDALGRAGQPAEVPDRGRRTEVQERDPLLDQLLFVGRIAFAQVMKGVT